MSRILPLLPCSVSTPLFLPKIHLSCPGPVQSVHHLFSSTPVLPEYHLSCPLLIRILPLPPKSSQFIKSPALIVRIPSITPLSSQNNNIFCPCIVSTPLLLPQSSQYTIWPVHFQSKLHLYCPHTVSTPPLLLMFSQYTTFPA